MGGEATGVAGLRRAVRERVEHRVDVVKIMTTGGLMTPGTDVLAMQFTADEVRVVVQEAHAAGLPVTAHAHNVPAIEVCVDAGVDGIEHCTCITADGHPDAGPARRVDRGRGHHRLPDPRHGARHGAAAAGRGAPGPARHDGGGPARSDRGAPPGRGDPDQRCGLRHQPGQAARDPARGGHLAGVRRPHARRRRWSRRRAGPPSPSGSTGAPAASPRGWTRTCSSSAATR